MKVSVDKTTWGLGLWWMRPDSLCDYDVVAATVGPIIIRIYSGHDKQTEAPLEAAELSFREGGVSK